MKHLIKTGDYVGIKELSEITGVSINIVGKLSREANLKVPHIVNNGHRLYSINDVEEIKKVLDEYMKNYNLKKRVQKYLNSREIAIIAHIPEKYFLNMVRNGTIKEYIEKINNFWCVKLENVRDVVNLMVEAKCRASPTKQPKPKIKITDILV